MAEVHVIRHKVLVEGQSARQVAGEMGVSRNTVRRYLEVAEPRRVEQKARGRPVLERVQKRMDELIGEWRERTTAKQRMTGTRLHRELVKDGHKVGVTLTNLAFSEWVQVFSDEKLTTALLDRLGHHGHILTTRGESFRTRRRKGASAADPGSSG